MDQLNRSYANICLIFLFNHHDVLVYPLFVFCWDTDGFLWHFFKQRFLFLFLSCILLFFVWYLLLLCFLYFLLQFFKQLLFCFFLLHFFCVDDPTAHIISSYLFFHLPVAWSFCTQWPFSKQKRVQQPLQQWFWD